MNIVNQKNLQVYLSEISDLLNWKVSDHRRIYQEVKNQKEISVKLDILENKVVPWFIRNGKMNPAWRSMIKLAITDINSLGYSLNDLNDDIKLSKVMKNLKSLGQIKLVNSGNENFVPISKLLNFIFPNLIPKIDIEWIENICLRKINILADQKRFYISGPVSFSQFREYLAFGASQQFNNEILIEIEKATGIVNGYAIAFEYCLLGFCQEEIEVKTNNKKQPRSEEKQNSINASDEDFGISDHREWLNHDYLKVLFDKIREFMKTECLGVNETVVKSYIKYSYRGEKLLRLTVYRNHIRLSAAPEWVGINVDEETLMASTLENVFQRYMCLKQMLSEIGDP